MPIRHSKLLKFNYADDGFSCSTAAITGYQDSYIFRANSCYDPDYSGVGVQPYGWDEWCALYGAYRCGGSKIKVNFYPTDTCRLLKVFLFPANTLAITHVDQSDLRQIPYCKCVTFGDGSGPGRHNKIKHYCTTRRINPDYASKDKDYQASVNANPSMVWYWLIYFDTTNTQEEITITFDVQITYYTIMKALDSINES